MGKEEGAAEGTSRQECINSSNLFHECSHFCLRKIEEAKRRLDDEWKRPPEERTVHPDCINASNPYHDCSEYCFKRIADAKLGFEAYLVGGCVRDLLLKRAPKDFDIKKEVFRSCMIIGRRFPICRINIYGSIIEVSSFRTNDKYVNGSEEVDCSTELNGYDEGDILRWKNSLKKDFQRLHNKQLWDVKFEGALFDQRIIRPWLGFLYTSIQMVPLSDLEQIYQTFPDVDDGLYISDVAEGSPADVAGLCEGDILIKCGGKVLSTAPEFGAMLLDICKEHMEAYYRETNRDCPREKITVEVLIKQQRDGSTISKTISADLIEESNYNRWPTPIPSYKVKRDSIGWR